MSLELQIGQITKAWALSQKIPTYYFSQTESTNDLAKNDAFTSSTVENEIVLYLTDFQTQGRGRFDRTWESAKIGSGLLSTWSFGCQMTPAPQMSLRIGLAVLTAAYSTWPFLNWNLKAPNDIFIDDKKIAGILIETISQADEFRLLIGLGMNVLAHPKKQLQATDLLEELIEKSVPFIGDDWIAFCERLVYELSLALQSVDGLFSESTQKSLLYFLNKNPNFFGQYENFNEVLIEVSESENS